MTTLVIGNGFDLDLGMNTRYSDFAKSEYWPKDVSSSSHNLQQYLNERKDMDCWFDLEQCLLDYCKPKRGISFGQDPFYVKLAGIRLTSTIFEKDWWHISNLNKRRI